MKQWFAAALLIATAALSSSVSAQWPLYPYANAPRTADGN